MYTKTTQRVLTQQPQGPVSIDWSNPLTQGIHLAVIPGNTKNIVFDYFTNRPLTSPSLTDYKVIHGPQGRVIYHDADNNDASGFVSTVPSNTSKSQLLVGQCDSTSRCAALGVDNGGYLGFLNGFPVLYYSGANITSSVSANAKGPVTLASRTRNGNFVLFRNGIRDGTGTGNYYDALGSTSAALRVGGIDIGFTTGYHGVALAVSWNRWLSDSELQRLSLNPWQIFKNTGSNRVIAPGVRPRTVFSRRVIHRQPNETTKINWTNPLTKNLVSVICPTSRADFVSGKHLSTMPVAPFEAGLGLQRVSTAPSVACDKASVLGYTEDVTIAVLTKRPASGATAMQFLRTGTGDYNGIYFGYNPTYDEIGYSQTYNTQGSRKATLNADRPSIGSSFTAVATKKAGLSVTGTDLRMYLRGKETGYSAATDGVGSYPTPSNVIEFSRDNGTTVTGTAPIALAVIANRIWTPAEVASFEQNPWQIFKADYPRLFTTEQSAVVKYVGNIFESNTALSNGATSYNYGNVTNVTVDNYILVLAKVYSGTASITDILVDGVSCTSISTAQTIYGHKVRWGLIKVSSGGSKSINVQYSGVSGTTNAGVVSFELKAHKLSIINTASAEGTPASLTINTTSDRSAIFSWAIGNSAEPVLNGNKTFEYRNTTNTETFEGMLYKEDAGLAGAKYIPWQTNRDIAAIEIGYSDSTVFTKIISEVISFSELFTTSYIGSRRIFIT